MTNHRVGKTNTKDPRPWRTGKAQKGKWDSTSRYLRRRVRGMLRRDPQGEEL